MYFAVVVYWKHVTLPRLKSEFDSRLRYWGGQTDQLVAWWIGGLKTLEGLVRFLPYPLMLLCSVLANRISAFQVECRGFDSRQEYDPQVYTLLSYRLEDITTA